MAEEAGLLLESMAAAKNKKDHFELAFSNGEALLCRAADVADFALYAGKELKEEEYSALCAAAALARTKERAAALLAYRAMSAGELIKKLCEKGESRENAEDAASWLAGLGVLNDEEYAKSIVRHYSAKGWGAGRIREELRRRYIPREYWQEALEELCGEEERIDRFIERRLSGRDAGPKEKKKISDALYRRGFSWEQIKSAMARYFDEGYGDDC